MTTEETMRSVRFLVVETTRPHSYAYEDDGERFGTAFASIRAELGFESNDEFSTWMYEEGQRLYGQSECIDVPVCLLDAMEYPALGWESGMYVVEQLAKVLRVSPGTLLDEIHLRASGRYRPDGTEVPEDEQ